MTPSQYRQHAQEVGLSLPSIPTLFLSVSTPPRIQPTHIANNHPQEA